MTYEPIGAALSGCQASSCEPGPSVTSFVQWTLLEPIPTRTASSRTRARRASWKRTVAVSRPSTPGATVANIGRSPANRFAAPRTARPVARGTLVSFPSAMPGDAPSAAIAPAAARSRRPRVSPRRTARERYRAGRRPIRPRDLPPEAPRPELPRLYGAGQVPLTWVEADAPCASVAVTSITTGPEYGPGRLQSS